MKNGVYIILLLLNILLCTLGVSAERFPLLFVSGSELIHSYVFRLLPTGELVTTGQVIDNIDNRFGISPDSRFVWFSWSLWQGEITPYGWITATGRVLPPFSSYAKYTPNGQMLIVADGPIYQAYPDGSVESTANIYNDRSVRYISPRGDIHLRNSCDLYDGFGGYRWIVERINYTTFNLNTVQHLSDRPCAALGDLAVFTPEGDYVALIHAALNYNDSEVVVYPILENGLLDTTRRQAFPMSSGALAITPDGNYIYIAKNSPYELAILRRISGAGFEDTGWLGICLSIRTHGNRTQAMASVSVNQ
jgi:hypothetical protein